jgi:YggT family protein
MSGSYLTNPIVFLVHTLFGLYTVVVLLRFLLQWARADFYNPVSQFVVKATTPLLRPLRRLVPGYGGMDLAALLLAWLVKALELFIVVLILAPQANPLGALAWALPELVSQTIDIFVFVVFARVILSWLNPDPYNPVAGLLDSLTEPVMRPARRLLPPVGGLDLSPVLVVIGLVLLRMLLIPPLSLITGNPF